jgi:methylenetetrahydrofolate dehydrogenase (NADP+) / methenyltetrahydrofolate cyclohydrolase
MTGDKMGQILDGKKVAAGVLEEVRARAAELAKKGIKPGLATVLVGDDPASHVYVGQKIKKCGEVGVESIHRPLPANVTQEKLIQTIKDLNTNKQVHGIIVQLPLPDHLDSEAAVLAIDPKKDADGLHPWNQGLVGRLKTWSEIESSGIPLPCTPAGIIHILLHYKIKTAGQNAVVVGRSTLVGKPVAQLLLSLDATVTIAHSRTKNLLDVCRSADILIAALGRAEAITKEGIKPGSTVIDVGITRTDKGLKGDVKFDESMPLAGWITPVPGGVGPMTVAMLLRNTVVAAEMS